MRINSIPSCLFIMFLTFGVISCQSDKYTDENRPYKFGFNIQGYQHRQEEKDERGLIKGEYGFITADGYYRVTVYATDENGDFRIISMKNIYVGFPPEDPQTTPQPSPVSAGQRTNLGPSRNSFNSPSQGQGPRSGGGSTRMKEPDQLSGLTACSDCLIPTTRKPDLEANGRGGVNRLFQTQGGTRGFQEPQRRPGTAAPGQGPFRGTNNQQDNGFIGGNRETGGGAGSQGGFGGAGGQAGQGGFGGAGGQAGGQGGFGGAGGQAGGQGGFGGAGGQAGGQGGFGGEGGQAGGIGVRNRDQISHQIGVSPQPNAAFAGRRPEIGSVRDGLPNGVTEGDIKALLYRFNYTVGFHGHHEDGYRNGDKEGDYFFDGRDGVERKVEYIANEFGYQPNITFIDLPENDVRRPNELTEKEYGLKGYEFKWFYRK